MTCKSCGFSEADGKFCKNCGAELNDDSPNAGSNIPPAPDTRASMPAPGSPPVNMYGQIPPPVNSYPPVGGVLGPVPTIGNYLFMMLLAMIPIAGFVLMIIWAVGGDGIPLWKSNYARASLIMMAISIALAIILLIVMATVIFSIIGIYS